MLVGDEEKLRPDRRGEPDPARGDRAAHGGPGHADRGRVDPHSQGIPRFLDAVGLATLPDGEGDAFISAAAPRPWWSGAR